MPSRHRGGKLLGIPDEPRPPLRPFVSGDLSRFRMPDLQFSHAIQTQEKQPRYFLIPVGRIEVVDFNQGDSRPAILAADNRRIATWF